MSSNNLLTRNHNMWQNDALEAQLADAARVRGWLVEPPI